MEFLRGRVTESAANTFTTHEIRTPASKTEKMAVLIHMISWDGDDVEGVEGTYASVRATLTNIQTTAIHGINNPENVDVWSRFKAWGRYEGTLSEYYEYEEDTKTKYFDPPILFARDSIWLSVHGIGGPSVKTVDIAIGYTLEKVTDTDFISALID